MFDFINKRLAYYRYSLLRRSFDEIKMLTAKSLILEHNKKEGIGELWDVEFNVFSQAGDDGIIQYLINKIPVKNKVFVEFGVENYKESNTRFLLMNNNWSGLVIDGSQNNINQIKRDPIYNFFDLKVDCSFITRENINGIIGKYINGDIGILSVDIDGNDFWVLDAINVVSPEILIVEYNALFGGERAITIPYNPEFVRQKQHYSNLYWGVSLKAIIYLANKKGYSFVGCNNCCINAYFVKKSIVKDNPFIKEMPVRTEYFNYKFRQSRNEKGELTYLNASESIKLLSGLPVYNVIDAVNEVL